MINYKGLDMKKIISLLVMVMGIGTAFAAIPEGKASPTDKSALEGKACNDEGTLNDIQAANPFICTDGKWRKVVFKDAGDGSVTPLFYEGKCSLRFQEGNETTGHIVLK